MKLTREQFISSFYNAEALSLSPSILSFLNPPKGNTVKTTCYVLPVKNLRIDNETGLPLGFNLSQALKTLIVSDNELTKYTAEEKGFPFRKIKTIVQKFSKLLQSLQSKFNNGVALILEIYTHEKRNYIDNTRMSYHIIFITTKNNVPVWAELPDALDVFFKLMKDDSPEEENYLSIEEKINTNLSVVRYIRDLVFINIKEDSALFKAIQEHLPQVETWRKELLGEYGITGEAQIPHLLSGDMQDERVIDFYIKLLLGTSLNYDTPQEVIKHIPVAVKEAIFVAISDEIFEYVVDDIYDYYDKDSIKENIKNSFDLKNVVKKVLESEMEGWVESYFMNNPIDEDDIEDTVDIDDIVQYLDETMFDWYYLDQYVIEPMKDNILSKVDEPSYYVISEREAIETFKEMLWDYIKNSRNPYKEERDKEEIVDDIKGYVHHQDLPHFIDVAVELIVNFAVEKFEEDEEFRDFIYDLVMDYVTHNPRSVLELFNEKLKPDEEIIEEAIRETISNYLAFGNWYSVLEKIVENYLRG